MDEHRERDAAAGPPPAPDGAPAAPDDRPPAGPPAAPAAFPAPPDSPPAPALTPAPGGVYPAVASLPGDHLTGPTGSPPPKRRRRAIGLVTGATAVVVAIFLKFGLPLLLGTAVSGILGNVFGGSYAKLPADQQHALKQRVDAAVGTRFDGVSDADQAKQLDAMVRSGLPRLADAPLVEKVHLTVKVLSAADEATCARIARAIATGVDAKDATHDALEAVDVESLGRWYDISVQAIEADAASAPVRTVQDADSQRILSNIANDLSETEAAQVSALYGSSEVSDADACGGLRAFYRHIETLPAPDLAIAALYDVAP